MSVQWIDNEDGTFSKVAEVERVSRTQIEARIASMQESIAMFNEQIAELEADLAIIDDL